MKKRSLIQRSDEFSGDKFALKGSRDRTSLIGCHRVEGQDITDLTSKHNRRTLTSVNAHH